MMAGSVLKATALQKAETWFQSVGGDIRVKRPTTAGEYATAGASIWYTFPSETLLRIAPAQRRDALPRFGPQVAIASRWPGSPPAGLGANAIPLR